MCAVCPFVLVRIRWKEAHFVEGMLLAAPVPVPGAAHVKIGMPAIQDVDPPLFLGVSSFNQSKPPRKNRDMQFQRSCQGAMAVNTF